MNSAANIYDALYTFESGHWQKKHYPIHKKLNTNDDGGLFNWLVKNIAFNKGENILDAGCGTGHVLISLWEKFNIKGKGISVSEKEIDHARQCLINQTMKSQLQFELHDYNESLNDQYDKILAIESLKHARDLEMVLDNFSRGLANNGTLIIVDDFVGEYNDDVEKQKVLWNAPQFHTLAYLHQVLKDFGFSVNTFDLTAYVPYKPAWKIFILQKVISLYKKFTFNSMKVNADTFSGALLLDKLYLNKHVQYCAVVASKKNNYATND